MGRIRNDAQPTVRGDARKRGRCAIDAVVCVCRCARPSTVALGGKQHRRSTPMDVLESTLKLLSSYPTWAKAALLANVACMAGILVFARTPIADATAQPAAPSGTFVLNVHGVRVFPPSDQDEIQCLIVVNGIQYRYPSIAGVDWLGVSSTMSGQTFVLPKAERYEIRFEVLKRTQSNRKQTRRLVSQETLTLGKPSSGDYRVHGFDPSSGTRSGTVEAEVAWSLGLAQ